MHLRWLVSLLVALPLLATPGEDMATAAKTFLAALDESQRAKSVFEFAHDERENFRFTPVERRGLPLKEMTPAQRHLAYGLLNSGLSQRGYGKAVSIMSLEQILQDMEGANRRFSRDPELYFVSIFGNPGTEGFWGWRVEGHHLAVNFTLRQGEVVAGTPSFFGSNPGEVRSGARKGLRVLGAEEDLGRQLVMSLSEEQRRQAVISTQAPDDILTGEHRVARLDAPTGLPFTAFTPAQRELADRLVREYAGRLRGELAEAEIQAIAQTGWEKVRFAWAGDLEPGKRHYYRIHGPTFVFEYDNTQNDANHIHAVWREFQGDFGRDLLAEHLRNAHGK